MASWAAAVASSLLLFSWLSGVISVEYTSQSLSTFVDTLVAEYDREVPPAALTSVALALDVRHAAVDDAAATMRLLADLKMSWTESRLTWNATLWEGDSVLVSLERLWMPDVTLVSAGGAAEGLGGSLRARLAAGGEVVAVFRLDLTVPIALQLRDWPNDVQEAVFTFASRAHTEQEMKLLIIDSKNSIVVESGAWEVVGVEGSTSTWRRGEEASSTAAQWAVRARRRGAARAAVASAALAAAALLLAAAAALPCAQRPPLAACAAFIAATWLTSASSAVGGAAASPRVVRVMCGVCACGAALAAAAAGTRAVSRRAAPPPRALRPLLSRISALAAPPPPPEEARVGAWAAVARLLDAVVVAALGLALLVLLAVHLFS